MVNQNRSMFHIMVVSTAGRLFVTSSVIATDVSPSVEKKKKKDPVCFVLLHLRVGHKKLIA